MSRQSHNPYNLDISDITFSLDDLLDNIKRNSPENKRYCFILGAGASRTSGLPTAATLAEKWLDKMSRNPSRVKEFFENEKDPEGKYIVRSIVKKNPAKFYSDIYQKCFKAAPDKGYAEIEEVMTSPEKNEPHTGYLLLAKILTKPSWHRAVEPLPWHPDFKIVITTNFDRLTEDAISFVGKAPKVIGHEALAEFSNPLTTTPTVIKLHRDLSFHPKNSSESTQELSAQWEEPLKRIFQHNTPIVIGYGGHDESLMNFLLEKNESQIFWCALNPDNLGLENDHIIPVVRKSPSGQIIEIEGFDEFMKKLANTLGIGYFPRPQWRMSWDYSSARDREKARLKMSVLTDQPLNVSNTSHLAKGEVKSRLEKVKLSLAWASCLPEVIEWWNGFEEQYQHQPNSVLDVAKKLQARDITITEFYYSFLASQIDDIDYNLRVLELRRKMEKNEIDKTTSDGQEEYKKYYEKRIEKNPLSARLHIEYADFLENIEELREAENHYKEALKIDPNDAFCLNRYATFLAEVKKDHDNAKKYFKKALCAEPENASTHVRYALFLGDILEHYGNAEKHYKSALAIDRKNANCLWNYAMFLGNRKYKSKKIIKKDDNDRAKEYYELALKYDPNNANILGSYAYFLYCAKKDPDMAKEQYKKAKEALEKVSDIHGALAMCNYCISSQNNKEALCWLGKLQPPEKMRRRDQLMYFFFRYVLETENRVDHSKKIQKLLEKGTRREGWFLGYLLEREHIKKDHDYQKIKKFAESINALYEKPCNGRTKRKK